MKAFMTTKHGSCRVYVVVLHTYSILLLLLRNSNGVVRTKFGGKDFQEILLF